MIFSEKPKAPVSDLSDKTILVASSNPGKVSEITSLLAPTGLRILSLDSFGKKKTFIEPIEDGQSFLENALIKARYYSHQSGLPTLADDSGLEVEALKGRLGIHSARYGGEKLSDRERCIKLLDEMKNKTNRKAYFYCALVLVRPDRDEYLFWEGRLWGEISDKMKGEGGFGYDPIFYYPVRFCNLAEIAKDEKNKLSHRGQTIAKMIKDPNLISFLN